MKLLELLVQELPKRGGWPEDFTFAVQDLNGDVKFGLVSNVMFYNSSKWVCKRGYDAENIWGDNKTPPEMRNTVLTDDYSSSIVTREQYESAIKPPEWNGEGLPPVGTEVSFLYGTHGWIGGTIAAYDGNTAIVRHNDGYTGCSRSEIQTESERKREDAINKIQSHAHVNFVAPISSGQATALYDAIIAHKIPGVTTVPNVGQIMRATDSCSREDAQKIVDLLNGA